MFTKASRYYKVPNVVAVDPWGRRLEVKESRLLPAAGGDFQHVVTSTDRLDHLAYRYYGEPRKWWRICDGNPEFLSPLALLGTEPIETALFPVRYLGESAEEAPWCLLLADLRRCSGICDALLVQDSDWVEERRPSAGKNRSLKATEVLRHALRISYNTCVIRSGGLTHWIDLWKPKLQPAAAAAADSEPPFRVESVPTLIDRIGKGITIPPDGPL